ncbi:flagellar hook assembly protein FlgD [Acuticoccus mangrovi]|uniref:Basal-body rod modification protein FlgD n=1 Tax=Acuticoccus mangrovi TaxID=2796142 RepID=A0A934MFH1_9HYPH|nr:flagellar hook assembly protein FlgD [Acuticoccus mangrovi]MBJ3778662.1 flagellar hook assembly protein FlgD [Acuticoccus mangrovi]
MTDYSAIAAVAANQTNATPTTTTEGTQTLEYDAFLRLLVTQMKNQDPLEPMSDTEYVAQLAAFSNVEQNILTNERLAAMLTANALGDAESLVGRTITAPTGEEGVVASVTISSEGSVARLVDGTEVPIGAGLTIS